ncbi:MAG TPA: hypothetical protein VID27_09910, partial [Blastocatellia bacterium]
MAEENKDLPADKPSAESESDKKEEVKPDATLAEKSEAKPEGETTKPAPPAAEKAAPPKAAPAAGHKPAPP